MKTMSPKEENDNISLSPDHKLNIWSCFDFRYTSHISNFIRAVCQMISTLNYRSILQQITCSVMPSTGRKRNILLCESQLPAAFPGI